MLQSQCYNWKAGATDESEDLRKKRMDVKRKARQAAEDKFDENKVASKNERRRKRYAEQKAAPATPAALNAEGRRTKMIPRRTKMSNLKREPH